MLLPYHTAGRKEAGLDEVGRGCLAGPVVAAAVILPENFISDVLDDSKKLSKTTRETLVDEIKANAVAWEISEVSPAKIDEINILKASFLAMHQALGQLNVVPDFLLVDGNRFPAYKQIPHECVVKGDGKYLSIAAASVLAKTYRDDLMTQLGSQFPGYGWERNVGYPTKEHREGIKKLGVTPHHRRSFTLLPPQLELF